MGKNTNKIIAAFLGIPYGTAMNRLRKQLLFEYVQKAGDDVCYVCEDRIESVDELSIEHMQPWLNRENGVEKFWDLNNIAFSHITCNRPHTNGAHKLRKMGPEGTSWCNACKEFKPVVDFHKQTSRLSGLQKQCKDCKSILNKNRYN